jgi:hypothetical protein
MPAGTHTLTVTMTDVSGKETTANYTFTAINFAIPTP